MYAKGTIYIDGKPAGTITGFSPSRCHGLRATHTFVLRPEAGLAWKKYFCVQKIKDCFCNVEEAKLEAK